MRHLNSDNLHEAKDLVIDMIEKAYKQISRDMRELLPNKFPLRIEATRYHLEGKGKLTHLHYDVRMDGKKTRILYLKPSSLVIDIAGIIRLYEQLGVKEVPLNLAIKTIEVITIHQFHHINMHSSLNFVEESESHDNKLVMGYPEVEKKCFDATKNYYMTNLDIAGVHLSSLLYLLYNEDIGRYMDRTSITMNIKSSLWEVLNSFSQLNYAFS